MTTAIRDVDDDRARETELRRFGEHSQEIIFRLRVPDGVCEYVSPAATTISGYTPEEHYATPFFVRSIIPLKWRLEFERGWDEVCQGIMPSTVVFPIIHKSGALRWVRQSSWVVFDERHQRAVAMEGIVIDVTDLYCAQEALRNSEQQYRMTVDSLSDMLHVVDSDLRFVLMNQTGLKWLKELGLEADPLGKKVSEVFPFLPPAVLAEYQAVFDSGKPLITQERTVVASTDFVTETRKIPIAQGGKVVRVVTVVRDVTNGVRSEERLRQAEKMEALGQLAGGIAHDFNNQLAAMLGYAELLSRRLTDDEMRGQTNMISRTAMRAADLTRQLLTFARKGRSRSEAIDVHSLIGEVVKLLGRTIDKRIHVRQHLAAAPSATMGDPTQLENAFLNLAINARDAMPDGGELTFSTKVVELDEEASPGGPHPVLKGRFIEISVCDTGVGMSEDTRRHLFEPFFTTKEPGKGTGMGLAAVYGTVMNHQGMIRVSSELGRGSVFTIQLPLAGSPAMHDTTMRVAACPPDACHILLVDDELGVREMLTSAFCALGYRVTACEDGAKALEYYRGREQGVDLVVLDMMMPNLDGHDTFMAMRAQNAGCKVVLIGGCDVDAKAQRLVQAGAVGFIQKPFHIDELFDKVARALQR